VSTGSRWSTKSAWYTSPQFVVKKSATAVVSVPDCRIGSAWHSRCDIPMPVISPDDTATSAWKAITSQAETETGLL
jgi:hypothetical protein